MENRIPDVIICVIIIATLGCIHILSNFMRLYFGGEYSDLTLSQLVDTHAKEYGWILKLGLNCFGYSCIFLPGFLIYKYTKRVRYLEKSGEGRLIPSAVRFCFSGAEVEKSDAAQQKKASGQGFLRECLRLTYCFLGLMTCHLTWGVLQEKIMTQEYEDADGKRSHFRDSQFLVFTNRFLAFVISGAYLFVTQRTRHRAPLYKYSFASLSNIMSAWFQYEALKFINFPTQVLAKSCKIIPVMVMGKIISKAKYEFYEYLTAGLISVGMVFFMTGSAEDSSASPVTTLTGVFLLTLYMIFDSFTSNWQGDLFKTYDMTSIQMMCGINLFSTLFTSASLSLQGGFMESLAFAAQHPKFVVDCVVLSISSALGQLFIFYTIACFGPVVFTIIMTVRQAIAILLSCLIYKHHISSLGVLGIFVVFLAISLRVYCNQRIKAIRRRAAEMAAAYAKPRLNA
ncbi:adenosine 3'-phospho 5'-phosphosulfate transporter 1 [Phlebotomus argentipes]|uniref:adenosine 3'-phospho 5'-phosphosulfate transporter 1 n=1 Tax=Phlebotomus argentipes TaxID=94469 RepID=UPI0028937BEB|nr:adenosine 3'-phospho 5'-phosphosulfate transporter 1 [Phlebotomus argentipes]